MFHDFCQSLGINLLRNVVGALFGRGAADNFT
jgi:hypothetical protein